MKIKFFQGKKRQALTAILCLVILLTVGMVLQNRYHFKIKADVTDTFFTLRDIELQPVKGKLLIWSSTSNPFWVETDDNGQGYITFTKAGTYKYRVFDSTGQELILPNFEQNFSVKSTDDQLNLKIDNLYPAPEPSVQVSSPSSQNQFSHTFQPGWHMMSLPAVPFDPNPQKVFAAIPKDILDGRLYYYSNALLSYVPYNIFAFEEFGSMKLGQGYWLNLIEPTTISYTGFEAPPELRNITLHRGWNMIGTPSNADIPLANIRAKNLSTGETKTLYDAAMAGWVSFPIYGYDNARAGYFTCGFDDWDEEHVLKPWFAYWVSANPDVELIFP
jgi:hypothetical protein